MPHLNGRIYSETVNGVKVGINTADISVVIGVNSDDIGTLCSSNQVVKWNKDKPYMGTQPYVKSRTEDNATNETGKYLGSRGWATGFPVYWGMRYPMNTPQQNASGVGSNNLLNLCFEVCNMSGGNHPNYTYQKPTAGTDYFREDDFDGYRHDMKEFVDAGVAGSKEVQTNAAELSVSYLDVQKLTVYARMPNDAVWSFKDLVPEIGNYYLVAEFYQSSAWAYKSTATPFLIKYASINTDSKSLGIDIPLSEILTAGGMNGGTDAKTLYVCVGFNKKDTSGNWVSGSGFVAPWTAPYARCATKIKVEMGSPYIVNINQYAYPTPTSESSYKNFPQGVNTTATSDTLYLKATVKNNGTNPLSIYSSGHYQSGGLKFRMRAEGAYGKYRADNANHTSVGGTDYHGAWRELEVHTNPNFTSGVQVVTIPANSQQTIYFKGTALLPYGETGYLITEVTKDGVNWAQSGLVSCGYFQRVP